MMTPRDRTDYRRFDDAGYVGLAQLGDTTAFDVLCEQYMPLVYALALPSAGYDDDMADELVQEVFLRAWLQLPRLARPSAFPAWLARITRTMSADWRRNGKRRSALVQMLPMDEKVADRMSSEELSPREAAVRVEASAQVRGALKQLPLEMQELLWLHYVEGVSQSDIARQLRVHPSTVKRKLERGAALLREKYRVAPGSLADALPAGDGAAESAHDRQRLTRTTLAIIAAASLLPQAQKVSLAKLAEQSWPTPAEPSFSFQQLSLGGQNMTYAGAAAVVVAGVAALMWWQPGAGNAEAVTGDAGGDDASRTVVTALAQGNAGERAQAHRRRGSVRDTANSNSMHSASPILLLHPQLGIPKDLDHDDPEDWIVTGQFVEDTGLPISGGTTHTLYSHILGMRPHAYTGELGYTFTSSFNESRLSDVNGYFLWNRWHDRESLGNPIYDSLLTVDHPAYVRAFQFISTPSRNNIVQLSRTNGLWLSGRVVKNFDGVTVPVTSGTVEFLYKWDVEMESPDNRKHPLTFFGWRLHYPVGADGYYKVDRLPLAVVPEVSVITDDGQLSPSSTLTSNTIDWETPGHYTLPDLIVSAEL